jgi:hypothetical protein
MNGFIQEFYEYVLNNDNRRSIEGARWLPLSPLNAQHLNSQYLKGFIWIKSWPFTAGKSFCLFPGME